MTTIIRLTLTIAFMAIGIIIWLAKSIILSVIVSMAMEVVIFGRTPREVLANWKMIVYDMQYRLTRLMGRK